MLPITSSFWIHGGTRQLRSRQSTVRIASVRHRMPLYEPVHLEGEDIELVLTHYDGSGTILGSFVNG